MNASTYDRFYQLVWCALCTPTDTSDQVHIHCVHRTHVLTRLHMYSITCVYGCARQMCGIDVAFTWTVTLVCEPPSATWLLTAVSPPVRHHVPVILDVSPPVRHHVPVILDVSPPPVRHHVPVILDVSPQPFADGWSYTHTYSLEKPFKQTCSFPSFNRCKM